MTLHHFIEWDGPILAGADAIKAALRPVQILKIFQVPQNGLAGVKGFRSPGTSGKPVKAFFNRLRQADGKHELPRLGAIQV
jgi:hypothetical protein